MVNKLIFYSILTMNPKSPSNCFGNRTPVCLFTSDSGVVNRWIVYKFHIMAAGTINITALALPCRRYCLVLCILTGLLVSRDPAFSASVRGSIPARSHHLISELVLVGVYLIKYLI